MYKITKDKTSRSTKKVFVDNIYNETELANRLGGLWVAKFEINVTLTKKSNEGQVASLYINLSPICPHESCQSQIKLTML